MGNKKEESILTDTLSMLNKKSKGSVYILDESPDVDVKRYSTGRLSLDIPIGGGIPEGRIIEIYGGESSGKTSFSLHTIASYQQQGMKCAFIDFEHAFDPEFAKKLGVDSSKLIFSQPTTAEEGLDIIDALISTGEVQLVVLDSVAAMVPQKELEGESGQSVIGVHARLMSQAMRKLAGKTYKNKATLIAINQTREKIGVMFGSPITTTGGNALKFYASIRIEMSRGTRTQDKDEVTGNRGKMKVVKNKTYAPYKTSEYDMVFGEGISKMGEIIDYASEAGIINKAGSWYSYGETRLGQGKENVKTLLEDNTELYDEIRTLVMSVYFPNEEEKEILTEIE